MIQIMKASAGSGKTFNLARKYITLLFRKEDVSAYRHILAVTFTNKATDEMKTRILKELHTLSVSPEKSPYLKWFIPEMFSPDQMEDVSPDDIVSELPGRKGRKITLESLKEVAGEMLYGILHDYSAFSVSTIDRFFQQALKAFSREIGQFSSYQVELDKNLLVEESIDRIFDSLDESKPELLKWLTECAMEDVEKDGRYELDRRLTEMASRLKSDAHRQLAEARHIDEESIYSYDNLRRLRKICSGITGAFENDVSTAARAILDSLSEAGLSPDIFYRGFVKVLYDYVDIQYGKRIPIPSAQFLERAADPELWFSKANAGYLDAAGHLEQDFRDFCDLFASRYRTYSTAFIISSQLYELGIATDLYREFDAAMKDRNVLSIDDSNLILKNIIDGSDAPFVYEKLGVRYDNFLLDEFQDTSGIQWQNFLPLLMNSDSQGFENLIVGDVKQSIYRWRGSEWNLLHTELDRIFPCASHTVLDRNFRSRSNIVGFNNSFYEFAAGELDALAGENMSPVSAIYSDVAQKTASEADDKGIVEISFCGKDDQENLILSSITELLKKGASYRDIAVLVRNNSSGASVAGFLIENGIPVITDDSLKVKSSAAVRQIVSLMSAADNPENTVGAYLAAELNIDVDRDCGSLVLLCEHLCRKLREADEEAFDSEITYVQSFVDCVLDYSSKSGNSLHDFLQFWNTADPNISSPAVSDSVRIMTIHKSKGLDFTYVIFPFAEKVNLFRPQKVWCSPETEGTELEAAGAGIFDVCLSEDSSSTCFESDYRDERLKQYIDNINTFYVATTRAVKGMHIISEMPSRAFRNSLRNGMPAYRNMSHILYSYLHRGACPGFVCSGDDDARTFRAGDFPDQGGDAALLPETVPVAYPSYPLNPEDTSRLVLTSDNEDFFDGESGAGQSVSARMKGVVLHKILSSVRVPGDIDSSVNDAYANGLIGDDEKDFTADFLRRRISSAVSRGWFPEGGASVYNETPIVDTDGSVYRPDRVVVSGDGHVVIIDYKFGMKEDSGKYGKQVRKYAELWKRMGYRDVEAYVWYVMTDEVC